MSTTDRRAADLVLESQVEVVHVEAERLITDLQAQVRAASLKRDALAARYDRPVRLIVAIPDTRGMRQLVREHASLLERTFPVQSHAVWGAIRTGRPVGGDGMLFVRLTSTHRPTTDTLKVETGTGSTHSA